MTKSPTVPASNNSVCTGVVPHNISHSDNDCRITPLKYVYYNSNNNNKRGRVVNRAIQMNRKWKVVQTVNNAIIIWDLKVKPKGILGGHLNIQSLKSCLKSDQLKNMLLESNLDYLGLTETWFTDNSPSAAVQLPGYNSYRRDQMHTKGGGVLIFVRHHPLQ